jgi:hypothetical protein
MPRLTVNIDSDICPGGDGNDRARGGACSHQHLRGLVHRFYLQPCFWPGKTCMDNDNLDSKASILEARI